MTRERWVIEHNYGMTSILYPSRSDAEDTIKTLRKNGICGPEEGVAVRVAVVPMRDQEEAA